MKALNINIHNEAYDELSKYCEKNNLNKSYLVRTIMTEFMKEKGIDIDFNAKMSTKSKKATPNKKTAMDKNTVKLSHLGKMALTKVMENDKYPDKDSCFEDLIVKRYKEIVKTKLDNYDDKFENTITKTDKVNSDNIINIALSEANRQYKFAKNQTKYFNLALDELKEIAEMNEYKCKERYNNLESLVRTHLNKFELMLRGIHTKTKNKILRGNKNEKNTLQS